MWRTYWKIAQRTLYRHTGYAVVNVAGLALGLTCCLLIALYLRHEVSYDRHHAKANQIYRLAIEGLDSDRASAASPGPIASLLAQELPEVVHATRLHRRSFRVERGDRAFQESNVFFADTSVFRVFDFDLLRGDRETALSAPFSVILSEQAATKYFGGDDPLGQTLLVNGQFEAVVSGVMAPLPSTSHLQFDILGSMSTVELLESWIFTNWHSLHFWTYIVAPESHDPAMLTAKVNAVVQAQPSYQDIETAYQYALVLEPLRSIYLDSAYPDQAGPTSSAALLYLLGGIGLFILLIACINFINLSTARSTERAKEVSVRKVMGAHRLQVAGQFLGEALLLCGAALLVAVALMQLLLPAFSLFVGKPLDLVRADLPWFLGVLLITLLAVGLLAGGYPALVLSGFSPIEALKGRSRSGRGSQTLRQGLVTLQFGISVALIGATAIVYQQLDYVRDQDPGFRTEQMLTIHYTEEAAITNQLDAVKAMLLQHPAVQAVAASGTTPAENTLDGGWNFTFETSAGTMDDTAMPVLPVDLGFIDAFGLEVVAGRAFAANQPTDATGGLVLNETAVTHLGYATPEAVLGRSYTSWPQGGAVIGVVRDFNFRSLHETIGPLALRVLPTHYGSLTLRLDTGTMRETLAELEALWASFGAERPLDYRFLDDAFASHYQAETRFGQIFALFAGLAILIACLGLFGLAAFTAQQRTKEIGIRKALGASVPQVLLLLSRDFARLVLLGFLLGAPVAYLTMQRWLDGFAYQASVSPLLFAGIGLLTLLVALLTVSYQALRAATTNPVEALRYE